ncbi:SF1B family DNA helicase RecD2 [Velocimicrobium porci]|uniref:ATP-dependent RecD2 DNA helicase n=1 Tax=Velocimicrobium porci TaxID=2606634 RepID=A0A6L5Y055_9FIRM|nr:ATP-dependent RecD-like DNA helicase [Velocimicrobium porci]
MAESFEGYVERIVFRNAENGYTVLSLSQEQEELTCVGTFTFINEGEYIEVTGTLVEHQLYGEQLKVESYQVKEPEDAVSMERYLGSGAIKGVGPALAARIVKKFKLDSFRVIEEEPERLAEIKGISERKAREIAEQFEDKREMRNAMMFLQQYGISNSLGLKIYNEYGPTIYHVLKENPYRLAEDIKGVGFKLADEIARKAGINVNADFRVKAGIIYTLSLASQSGHTYVPEDLLIRKASELLGLTIEEIEKHLTDMALDKRLVMKETEEGKAIYNSTLYYMEMNCARMLLDLNLSYQVDIPAMERRILGIEELDEIELDEMQRAAVVEGSRNGVLIITGGPGTGKTTTINTLIRLFESEGMDIMLGAPTGRAAKRMSETTGYEAQTIHRMLELKASVEDGEGMHFERNETNPLETDVIIIDEMSMVDIYLFHALLKALVVGTRLILVGDINQLPSVGPGNVLRDIIDSKSFPVVELKKIFRQAAESDIVLNAHKINEGKQIALDNKSMDFFMLQRMDVNQIISVVIQLIQEKMPRYVHAEPYDIQVLTPMRKGELGVERLNRILQQYLNPPDESKKEKEIAGGIFREGDKVMQVKNNYQLEWELTNSYGIVVEKGTGVFNGDCGIIKEINFFAELVTVQFEEEKLVEYRFTDLDELELAYAVTVHKSQGSEYPAVVIPVLSGPRMLFTRNILYTAVTRAKSCVTLVGNSEVIKYMIENVNNQKRYTSLDKRIEEMNGMI